MLRFSCPRCRAVHALPPDHAGRKLNCPKCQQRLQVPTLAKSKTVLAPLVGDAPPLPVEPNPVIADARTAERDVYPWTIVAAVVLFLLVAFAAVVAFSEPRAAIGTLIIGVIVLVFLSALGLVLFFLIVYPSICPKCGKWFGKEDRGEEPLSTEKAVGLVTRRSFSTAWGSGGGKSWTSGSMRDVHHSGSGSWLGSTSWQERVPIIRTTWQHFWGCPHCSAEWTTTSVEEVEDVSRD